MQRALLRAVFYGIVEQVEDYVGKVHLVDHHQPVEGIEIGRDAAAVLLHLELECVYDIVHGEVGVDFIELERGALAVEKRHLEHLLHLKPQALGLVGDDRGCLLQHGGRLAHGRVAEHLRGQRYRRYGCLELVGHIVDEIIFHLRELFLTEGHDDGEYKDYQQYERESQGRYHKRYGAEDEVLARGEIYLEEMQPAGRVARKQCLHESIVGAGAVGLVACRAVLYDAGVVEHCKLKRHVEAECVELLCEIAAHHSGVCAVGDGAGRCGGDDIEYHIVDDAFLIQVMIAVHVLHRAEVLAHGRAVGLEAGDFRGLSLDGDVGLEAGSGGEGVLDTLLHGESRPEALSVNRLRLNLTHLILKEMARLVLLKPDGNGHQRLAHSLRELLVTDAHDILHIEYLNKQKA